MNRVHLLPSLTLLYLFILVVVAWGDSSFCTEYEKLTYEPTRCQPVKSRIILEGEQKGFTAELHTETIWNYSPCSVLELYLPAFSILKLNMTRKVVCHYTTLDIVNEDTNEIMRYPLCKLDVGRLYVTTYNEETNLTIQIITTGGGESNLDLTLCIEALACDKTFIQNAQLVPIRSTGDRSHVVKCNHGYSTTGTDTSKSEAQIVWCDTESKQWSEYKPCIPIAGMGNDTVQTDKADSGSSAMESPNHQGVIIGLATGLMVLAAVTGIAGFIIGKKLTRAKGRNEKVLERDIQISSAADNSCTDDTYTRPEYSDPAVYMEAARPTSHDTNLPTQLNIEELKTRAAQTYSHLLSQQQVDNSHHYSSCGQTNAYQADQVQDSIYSNDNLGYISTEENNIYAVLEGGNSQQSIAVDEPYYDTAASCESDSCQEKKTVQLIDNVLYASSR